MRRIWFCIALSAYLVASTTSNLSAQEKPATQPGWMGIQMQDLLEAAVKSLGVNTSQAVLVVLPLDEGPAKRAGVPCRNRAHTSLPTPVSPVSSTLAGFKGGYLNARD